MLGKYTQDIQGLVCQRNTVSCWCGHFTCMEYIIFRQHQIYHGHKLCRPVALHLPIGQRSGPQPWSLSSHSVWCGWCTELVPVRRLLMQCGGWYLCLRTELVQVGCASMLCEGVVEVLPWLCWHPSLPCLNKAKCLGHHQNHRTEGKKVAYREASGEAGTCKK